MNDPLYLQSTDGGHFAIPSTAPSGNYHFEGRLTVGLVDYLVIQPHSTTDLALLAASSTSRRRGWVAFHASRYTTGAWVPDVTDPVRRASIKAEFSHVIQIIDDRRGRPLGGPFSQYMEPIGAAAVQFYRGTSGEWTWQDTYEHVAELWNGASTKPITDRMVRRLTEQYRRSTEFDPQVLSTGGLDQLGTWCDLDRWPFITDGSVVDNPNTAGSYTGIGASSSTVTAGCA